MNTKQEVLDALRIGLNWTRVAGSATHADAQKDVPKIEAVIAALEDPNVAGLRVLCAWPACGQPNPCYIKGEPVRTPCLAELRLPADAIAEGSASSEGAEAVAWLANDGSGRVIDAKAKMAGERAKATASAVSIYSIPLGRLTPQPAQGEHEQSGDYWIESERGEHGEYIISNANHGECIVVHESESHDSASVARKIVSALNGKHEPRSCEGSEQRPIDEVVELSNSLEEDAALLRGLIDDGVGQTDSLDRIADSMERASELLKSALPRILPAGSDVGTTAEMTPRRATYFMERFKRDEKMLGPNEQKALDYVIAMLATAEQPACTCPQFGCRQQTFQAEQPSCGQDAGDADAYAILADYVRSLNVRGSSQMTIDNYELAAIDKRARAAIAAKQRQGGDQ